jgi:hypothetical protein
MKLAAAIVLGLLSAARHTAPPAGGEDPVVFRSSAMTLELYGGIPLYNDMFSGYEPNDRTAANAFTDKAVWLERLERLADLEYNAITLYHPHPFPLFVDYADAYPEAAWLTPDELASKREFLNWLINAADNHGISLYFLTWNVWIPRGLAEAHGIPQHGVDSDLTRDYTRWTVTRFFETYPGFGGLMTMAGETPVGCFDFVEHAIVEGLEQAPNRPRFILFTWCSYPDEVKAVLDTYTGPTLAIHYLQYEQLFYPKADPRIGSFSRAMGGQTMAALGGLGNPYLFFSNPEFVHALVTDAYAHNQVRGFVVQDAGIPVRWLGEEAFARSMAHPTQPYDEDHWRARVAARYGSDTLAAPLLDLMKQASLVMPVQMKLLHSQSDHYQPQGGMPLVQMLEMPTLSTYVFENTQELDEHGYLKGHLGLSEPNPDWGEKVIEIGHYVRTLIEDPEARARAVEGYLRARRQRGFAPEPVVGGERTPVEVVTELESLLDRVEAGLARAHETADQCTQARPELDRILHLIGVNLGFGRYCAAKARAAIALERYRVLGDAEDRQACLQHLAASVEAWGRYARVTDEFYGGTLYLWCSRTPFPPPFSQNDIWFSYRQYVGSLTALTPTWERELDLVRLALGADDHRRVRLPITVDLRPPTPGGRPLCGIDFEAPDTPRYAVGGTEAPSGRITTDADQVITGSHALLCDSRKSALEWSTCFVTLPQHVRFRPDTHYEVSFRYRVVAEGEHRAPFAVFLRTQSGGLAGDVGEDRTWGQREGTLSQRVFTATTGPHDDYHLAFALHGKAALVIDDLLIVEHADGQTTPD